MPKEKKAESQRAESPGEQPRLLRELLATKAGLFGSPEKKLRADIAKRLKVGEGDAFSEKSLIAYSQLGGVKEKLEKVRAEAAKREAKEARKKESMGAGETPAAGTVGANGISAEQPPAQKGSMPLFLLVSDDERKHLLEELKELRKGRFGDPEKKLAKDIAKRLKVDKKEALKACNIETYANLDDVKRCIEKFEAAKQARAEKDAEKAAGKRKESLIIRPDASALTAAPPITRETSERADRVEELLEEQKRMAEEDAKRKAKRKRKLFNPFAAVTRLINKALGRLFRDIFLAFVLVASIPIILGKFIVKGIGGVIIGFSRRVGRFSPFGWKKRITQLIIYSGMTKTQEEVTGMTIMGGAALGAIVAIAGFLFLGFDPLLMVVSALVSFLAVWIVAYAALNLMVDKRTDEVEGTLPDVLQIVSANISAGMTPYNALWVSARKEFGALAEEIKIAQKQTLGGKPFADALTEMGTRVRSNIFQRTIRLLIQGMKAGGELPQILNGISTDIRQMRLLQREMAANTMSYILFILFGMILGAPLLFSVSIQFVDIMNRFQPEGLDTASMDTAQMGAPTGGISQGFNVMSLGSGKCPKDFDGDGIPDSWEKKNNLNPKNASDAATIDPDTGETYLEDYQKTAEPIASSCITPGYLSTFAIMALASIAFFGSILIGLIQSGKQSAGLKLIPLLMLATLGMFILMNKGLSIFFGAMFGG